MNKAINREELLKVLYKRATPTYVRASIPTAGLDPLGEALPEMYGYDPKKAKQCCEADTPRLKAKACCSRLPGRRSSSS